MESALEATTRLWAGETVTLDGGWFRCQERCSTTRSAGWPKLYASAFGPQAAAVAGRWADGIWTLANPEKVPAILDAYRGLVRERGTGAGRDQPALRHGLGAGRRHSARGLKGLGGDDPPGRPTSRMCTLQRRFQELAEEKVDEQALRESLLISADPEEHVARVREIEQLGATVVCLQNMSGADPMGTIAAYAERVLPALRA